MEHLSFQDFTGKIASTIKSYLPEEYKNADIHIQQTIKPGDKILTGISVHRPDCGISPIIYLDNAYKAYRRGERIEIILQELARTVQNETISMTDLRPFLEWDTAKDYVTSRFINRERNAGYIANRPGIALKESPISIIFDVDLSDITGENMSVPVTFSLMEKWDITIPDLEETARENTHRLRPVSIQSIGQMISQEFPGAGSLKAPNLLYVITNENLDHGAIAVTYPGVEEYLRQLMGSFYLLPSSVHEMFAVSRNMASPHFLTEMIQEINERRVAAGDVLDNIPYILENGQLIPAQMGQ